MKIDNFTLSQYMTCPLKFKERIIEGWTGRSKSAALGFGGALHEGLAAWYRTGNQAEAIKAIHEAWPANSPVDDYRNEAKCISVMVEYMRKYSQEAFKVVGAPSNPMIECTFTLDTGMYLSCLECGPDAGVWRPEDYGNNCPNCNAPLEPIEYGGIFDGLVESAGSVYVLEHKTTSQLGSYYFNQFKPNNQVSGYVWAAGLLSGRRVGGALINAIGVYKSQATKFERQLTTRSQDNITEWLEGVRQICELIQMSRRNNYWPMNTGACTLYGQCEYHSVHVLGTETERQKMLEQQYVRDSWEYEARTGVKGD